MLSSTSFAGRSCEPQKTLQVRDVKNALELAEKTTQTLNRTDANVVLIARAGQDLSKYNVRYSHLGIAYKIQPEQGAPYWRVYHKLNACGTDTADIYEQGLGHFFMDDLWRYEAAIMTPTPEAQTKLLKLIDSPQLLALHKKPYSMVSYAWGTTYQQSNQWVLETLGMALDKTPWNSASRVSAQHWLQEHAFKPADLKIDPLTRLGARISAANIAFDDHPAAQRWTDHIQTITVDSIFDWMPTQKLSTPLVTIRLE